MSDIYYSPKTNEEPEIFIDYDNNIVKLIGKCLIENAHGFFLKLLEKIVYIDNLIFIIDLEYVNSSSFRHIIGLIENELTLNEVHWYYMEEDFDMEEKGRIIKDMLNTLHSDIIFKLISK
jgi:hypothetical protein